MAGNGWLILGVAGYDLSQLSGNIYGAGNNHLHTSITLSSSQSQPQPLSGRRVSWCALGSHHTGFLFILSSLVYLPRNTGE